MNRCVATNPAGARCMYEASHGTGYHLYPDDPSAFAFRYGRLAALVELFLDGQADSGALRRHFDEIEATLSESAS